MTTLVIVESPAKGKKIEDLEEALTKLKKEEPMWFGSYKPDALVRKICYQNISEFVFRNF